MVTWVVLLAYPTVTRKTLLTFACVELRGRAYLKDDPSIECYTHEWRAWAAFSVALGIVGYAIGLPLLLLGLARSYRDGVGLARKRVRLLIDSYTPAFWFFEAADLVRKLLLTSVVVLVAPNTKLQLYFGQLVALVSLVSLLRCEPYRDRVCGRMQLVAQLSIVLAYMAANVFFLTPAAARRLELDASSVAAPARVDGLDANMLGAVLVATSGAVLAGAALWYVVTIRQADAAARANSSTFQALSSRQLSHGTAANAPRSIYADGTLGWHLFLSHVWAHAQDQASAIKYMLRNRHPELRVFLDVDNLDSIGRLEEHIRQSDAVLVFLTRQYLTSANCRRELVEAIGQSKELLVVQETKEEQGAATLEQLREEAATALAGTREREAAEHVLAALEGACLPPRLLPAPRIVLCTQWFRERYLRHTLLFELICRRLPCFAAATTPEDRPGPDAPPVYVSPHYERIGAAAAPGMPPESVRGQLCAALSAAGIGVVDAPVAGASVLVMLSSVIFVGSDDDTARGLGSPLLDELKMLLSAQGPFVNRPRIIALASTASPFGDYINLCPQELKDLKLFEIMFHKWPAMSAELHPVAAAHAALNPVPSPARPPAGRAAGWRWLSPAGWREWRVAELLEGREAGDGQTVAGRGGEEASVLEDQSLSAAASASVSTDRV